MKKSSHPILVLYDSQQNAYLCKPKNGKPPTTTSDEALAWRFPEKKVGLAWNFAYKAAWLDIGKFYVHGIKE